MGKGDKRGQAISSSKAAELLAKSRGNFSETSGVPAGGASGNGRFAFGAKYIGQVSSSIPTALAQGAPSAEVARAAIIPSDLDGELSQQLQKLSKRDATTKLKALQALKVLVKDRALADVQQAVPPWAYLYAKLVMDSNRSVRSEANQVMGAVASALGRTLAPFLKALVPSWWMARFDVYGEASAAAMAAFQAAFPAGKEKDVLRFCHAEVVQLLSDNLASTPQSLGDSKKEAPEELQDRHERVLVATCASLGALLGVLGRPAGDASSASGLAASASSEADSGDSAFLQQLGQLVRQPVFLKGVLQSKSSPVRRAGLLLVAKAASAQPQLLEDHLAEAAPPVLGSLSEKDPSNHAAMWEALLSFAKAYPGCWSHLNLPKAFLPRLWSLLRHACYGSASASFPALLPLVALLPKDVLSPSFFGSLLNSTWLGLGAVTDAGSKRAAASCFQECLAYPLLRAEQLAGEGSTSAGSLAVQEGGSAVQQYCMEIMEAVLPQTLLPAAISESSDGLTADLAAAALRGVASRLAGTAGGSGGSAGEASQPLRLLLKLAGSFLSFAVQQSLEQGVEGVDPQVLEQGLGGGLVCFDRASGLVEQLADAAGEQQDLVGELVCRPLIAVLLPEVRAGSAPAAASSLLASLLKRFPQHAAVPAAPHGTELEGEGEAETCEAGSTYAAGLGGEMSTLRLQQSASFTIESVLRRLERPEGVVDEATLGASCDLLLSCLPQVADPGAKLGEALLQLVAPRGGSTPAVEAGILLLQHVISGSHQDLTIAGCRSAALDRVGEEVTAAMVGPALRPAHSRSTAAATVVPVDANNKQQLAKLLSLLCVGNGQGCLLSLPSYTKITIEISSFMEVAAKNCGSDMEESLLAVLQLVDLVLQLGVPDHGTHLQGGHASDVGNLVGVHGIQLQILAHVYVLAVQQVVCTTAALLSGVSEEDSTQGSDGEEMEAPQSDGMKACRDLAWKVWNRHAKVHQVMTSASLDAQAAFQTALHSAMLLGITQLQSGVADEAVRILGITQLVDLAQLAIAGCCGQDEAAVQQFLLPLLKQELPEAATLAPELHERQYVQQYSPEHAEFLLVLGQAAGFDLLLGQRPGGLTQQQGAAVAVGAITAVQDIEPVLGDSQHAQQLVDHLMSTADTGAPTLLSSCLELALEAAVVELHAEHHKTATPAHATSSEAAGPGVSAGWPDTSRSPKSQGTAAAPLPELEQEVPISASLAVLCRLLRAAVNQPAGPAGRQHSSLLHLLAADFFAERIVCTAGDTEPRGAHDVPLPVLLAVLPIVAPSFRRGGADLLERSRLPQLAARLCRQGSTQNPPLQLHLGPLLLAASSCFPVPEVPLLPMPPLPPPPSSHQPSAQGAAPSAPATHAYAKGDLVWYQERDGTHTQATVTLVDTSHHPPSYGVDLPGGRFRETEGSRLQPRGPATPPPPPAAPATSSSTSSRSAGDGAAASGVGDPHVGAVPLTTKEEREALVAAVLALLQEGQSSQGPDLDSREPAAPHLGGTEDPGGSLGPVPVQRVPSVPHAQGAAHLTLRVLVYCWKELSQAQWGEVLGGMTREFARGASQWEALAAAVAAAVVEGGERVAGVPLGGARGAVQFWRSLCRRGLLDRSQKARSEVALLGQTLQQHLQAASCQLLPLFSCWLQAFSFAAAASSRAVSLPVTAWQGAEAAACGDTVQSLVAIGALVAAVGVTGEGNAAALGGWLGGETSWQQLLSQQVLSTLRVADGPFLESALARANELEAGTGSDALGALLALALDPAAPHRLRATAYETLLLQAPLLGALSAAGGVSEEDLEGSELDDSDGVALLEQVTVRPELASVVGTPSHPSLLPAWALLISHILAQPPASHVRRVLVQTLKEGHQLLPGVLDALVPLLPLRDSGAKRGPARQQAPAPPTPSNLAAQQAPPVGATIAHSVPSQFLAIGLPAIPSYEEEGAAAPVDSAAASTEAGAFAAGPSAAVTSSEQTQRQLASLLYSSLLQALPASARIWFSSIRDRGTAAAVERYTAAAVSGGLLATEFEAVAEAASALGKFDKFSARANPTSREVVAVMEVEDGHMLELVVKLPACMPLRPPELECRKRVGVSEGRLRKWLLSIAAFLRMQNGSVAEAIFLWKKNVDKEFEGQEECLICYSILQPSTGQLPRLACRTCRKRFHGGCLYKWFKSSGKSNCPHCQSPW